MPRNRSSGIERMGSNSRRHRERSSSSPPCLRVPASRHSPLTNPYSDRKQDISVSPWALCSSHSCLDQNNPYLSEIVRRTSCGSTRTKRPNWGSAMHDGGGEVASGAGFIRAFVTDHIHPETVFMLHGFGHEAQMATRCFNKGLSDSVLTANVSDKSEAVPRSMRLLLR